MNYNEVALPVSRDGVAVVALYTLSNNNIIYLYIINIMRVNNNTHYTVTRRPQVGQNEYNILRIYIKKINKETHCFIVNFLFRFSILSR